MSSLLEWNNALYSVQSYEFDSHHQKLVDYINDLHNAMLKGQGKEKLSQILDEMAKYTQYHFDAEEAAMGKAKYPGLEEHRVKHADLVKKLSVLINDYKLGKREVSIETFKFLKEWLFNHIQVEDKKYTPWLKKHD